jgi:hypothetical protein
MRRLRRRWGRRRRRRRSDCEIWRQSEGNGKWGGRSSLYDCTGCIKYGTRALLCSTGAKILLAGFGVRDIDRTLIIESKILESIIVMSPTSSFVVPLSLAEVRYLIESSAATNVSSVSVHMDRMQSLSPKDQICCIGTIVAS